MESDDLLKYPRLRDDLKISKMVQREKVSWVIKDPIKNAYFKFEKDEWLVISLFDGQKTAEEMVSCFNQKHKLDEIDLDVIKDFKSSLEDMGLLQKNKQETNVMLVEKMKEMRKSQLMSKKGSLMYKRFPLVDPDRFFAKIIPHITFFWKRPFFLVSSAMMLGSILVIALNFEKFNSGINEIFSFNEMSVWNALLLWVIVYVTIGIHELGHGLTCKYYGGEVHEIGFLLLFFQPCLYCNVNDAWLFDRTYKKVFVTLAGGYIEFWIGSIFAYIWILTNPNTFINVISFQVMTICSLSTIVFNFNPLVKLDGYYLFSDIVEIPNLKESSAKYLKYLASRYIFRMPGEDFEGTKREKRVLFFYGLAGFFWVFGLLTGLVAMAHGMLVEHLYEVGVVLTGWVAWKVLGGHVKKSGKFLGTWIMRKVAFFRRPEIKIAMGVGAVAMIGMLFFPLNYRIRGKCTLEPSAFKIVRAPADGKLTKFYSQDGSVLEPDQKIAQMDNFTLDYDRKISEIAVEKVKMNLRKNLVDSPDKLPGLKKELQTKQYELQQKVTQKGAMQIRYQDHLAQKAVLSCVDQVKKSKTYLKEGDEICRVLGVGRLRSVVQVTEQEVRFLKEKQPVQFKLVSSPFRTYAGVVTKIRMSTEPNPKNPKEKIYHAEIDIDNPGNLKPGMIGKAKILANEVFLVQYLGIKLASVLRLDLFY